MQLLNQNKVHYWLSEIKKWRGTHNQWKWMTVVISSDLQQECNMLNIVALIGLTDSQFSPFGSQI